MTTDHHKIVSRSEWLEARKQLLAREKQFTHQRDELAAARRDLPWVKVTEHYELTRARGKASLADLFDGRSQLVVYHFMFGPDWEAGCKSCSFWADNFNGIVEHLAHRDVSMVAISRAPLAKLQAYARRLGWTFEWVSSGGTSFNYDFGVSFTPDQLAGGEVPYNYGRMKTSSTDHPGISVFYKQGNDVFHTYSCFARGIDMMNTAYQYLDLVPKGRDEGPPASPMSWLRRRDEYGA
jgi:predicted dithiol-disulfide oxidoreductase (DUF899 family)